MHGNRYFCFTAYTDNEQEEAGDTTIHTFIKHNWPHCQTRYFYFIGTRFGLPSPSTTPVFEKHFNQAEAPPPPEHMDELVSIEPQFYVFPGPYVWTELDLSHIVHPDATGIIFSAINTDVGAERYLGLRAAGSAHDFISLQKRVNQTWGIIPLSADKKIDYWPGYMGKEHFWVYGYTGPNVHFLEPPVEITPPLNGVWTVKDLAALAPGAKAVILEAGAGIEMIFFLGARCNGSTDARTNGCYHVWPIIKCDATQKIELYINHWGAGTPKVYLIGYITNNVTMETNALNKLVGAAGAWNSVSISDTYATPKFAFMEIESTAIGDHFGAQKEHSLRNVLYDVDGHNWPIVHCNDKMRVELYRQSNVQGWWLQGVSR